MGLVNLLHMYWKAARSQKVYVDIIYIKGGLESGINDGGWEMPVKW